MLDRDVFRQITTQACVLGLLLVSGVPVLAQPPSEALVREALACTRAEERFTVGRDNGFKAGFNSVDSSSMLPEAVKQEILRRFQRVADQVFSWRDVESRFIELYQTHYTKAELEGLMRFCSDPAYRALVEADLKMIPASLQIGVEFQPQIQSLMQKELEEVFQELSQ